MTTSAAINPFESAKADLHEVLATLRRDSPVVEVALPTGATAWLVTRYADAQRALGDPLLGKTTSAGGFSYREMVPPDVARAVVYMASLPLSANVPQMTVMATKMPYLGRG